MNSLSDRNAGTPGAGCVLSRWLFLRLLGFVYLAAFASAFTQVEGLIGSRGVLPAADYLRHAHEALGEDSYLRLPTLLWLDAGDAVLSGGCIAGLVLAGLLVLGIAPMPVLAALWALYLSLVVAGQEFFGYQWDGLLLETGLYAVFFAPSSVWPRPSREAPPSAVMRWMLRWLLVRLVLASGIAKLLAGDPTWRDLSALQYHYETQPLPTWTSWYMHQLPDWCQAASVIVVFVVELALPVLLFGPRRWRHAACLGMAGFQIVLMGTGNFGFFNLLTFSLCLVQLDDTAFPVWMRRRLIGDADPPPISGWRNCLIVPVAVVLFGLSLLPFAINAGLATGPAAPLVEVSERAAAFHSVNSYGLFTVMTTSRREIVIEGSADGQTWLPYELPFKPGDINRRPEFTGLHLPRLDWQMWFLALGDQPTRPWFGRLLERLGEGSPPVLALLERNPFPAAPPRFLRATLYQYHFTDPETKEQTGAWWLRRPLGLYAAPRQTTAAETPSTAQN